ncbi:MAG: MlaD family protein [Saprospiraceae bacterium]|nr:MlaD family protein [Saprospiraceae bacterium]MCF8250490.1 MlaD family protein [Saprospiraceae bacterium]MCF8281995.1 MlaD family protein [Bacteroidales bacterium]MCF8312364.1 MlaD family protein [Saprospiraceae bacterium]MCF8440639.1 MlaD family protein [Saprospiraceae bacterium]
MAKSTANNIRLGIFVTLGLFLFTSGVYIIGAQQHKFGEQYHLSTFFQNANGLQVGHNVRYSGIKVGSVEDIIFLNDTTLEVKMLLNKDLKKLIRKNATTSIGSEGLVGDVVVNIKPGGGTEPLAKDGDILPSDKRRDGADMMETLGGTNENIAVLAKKLLEISNKLNEGDGTIPMLIRDSLMAADFASTLKNLRIASDNFAKMSQQLSTSINGISEGKGTLGYLLNDQTLPHQMEDFMTRLDSVVIKQTEPVIANLQKSGEDIAASSAALKTTLQSINSGDGLANALLNDTIATTNLMQTLDNLNEGTARFSENMEALKHNFFFRRYFKKQAKAQKKKN